jgi:hypothetical protein
MAKVGDTSYTNPDYQTVAVPGGRTNTRTNTRTCSRTNPFRQCFTPKAKNVQAARENFPASRKKISAARKCFTASQKNVTASRKNFTPRNFSERP